MLGINIEDYKELLSMWLAKKHYVLIKRNYRAKNYDLNDIIIAYMVALKGYPTAINTVY